MGGTELKIVTPEKGTGAGQTDTGAAQKLSKDLALANEQLQSLTSENVDLKDQLSQSDAVIADLKRLIELKDDELATLQRQLEGMQQQAEAAAPAQEAAAPTPAAGEAAKPAAEKAKPAPKAEEPAPGIVDQVMNVVMKNLVIIAGSLGALLLVLLALILIRRRAAAQTAAGEEITAEALEEFGPAEETEMLPGADETEMPQAADETEMPTGSEDETVLNLETEAGEETGAETGEEAGEEALEEAAEEHTVFTPPPEPEREEVPISEAELGEDTLAEGELPEENEEDELAEVNVFLAYEHFDQAEEFVREAIKRHPDNLDYHSKLLEVFYAAGDKAKYEEAAKVLHDMVKGTGPHWDMALVMWQEMSPNRELFAEPVAGEEEETGAETTGGGIVDLTADLAGEEEDTGLDFDLGMDEKKPAAGEDTLDITKGGADMEDILDVTAAVGLDVADELPEEAEVEEAEDHMLDITGGKGSDSGTHTGDTVEMEAGGGEDLLDVTAHTDLEGNGLDEDLMDVTSATSAGADSNELLEVASEEEPAETAGDEGSLDFDISDLSTGGGEEAEAGAETAAAIENEDSLEFDIGVPEPETSPGEKDRGAGNVLDFDTSGGAAEDDGGLELDLSADEGSASDLKLDSGLEGGLSLEAEESEEGGEFSLDVPQDESAGARDEGMNLDFTGGGDSGQAAPAPDLSIDLEIEEDKPGDSSLPEIDMESTVEIPTPDIGEKGDEDDEGEDATMFVARSSDTEEQSAEDEMASKLDLAKAYVELGDKDSAKSILEEVIADGSEDQRKQARELLDQVS